MYGLLACHVSPGVGRSAEIPSRLVTVTVSPQSSLTIVVVVDLPGDDYQTSSASRDADQRIEADQSS